MPSRWTASGCLALVLFMTAVQARAAFHFSDPTTYKPANSLWSTAIADFDGDGRQDVATVADGSSDDRMLFIYFTKASGGFDPVVKVKGLFPVGGRPPLVARDLNNDGRAEIVIGHAAGVALVHVDASRRITFAQASGPFTNLLSVGDVNGDGFQDIVSDTAVYYANAQGNLGPGGALDLEGFPYPPVAIAVEDMDRDGRDDLIATNGVEAYVYESEAGGFTSSPQTLSPGYEPWPIGGVAAADFNHDGRVDVSVTEASNSPTVVSIFHRDALGNFPDKTDFDSYDVPKGMFGVDVDKDGIDDLLVMHDGWASVGIYFQTDAGLADELLYPSATSHLQTGMALGDVNGDGCTDIAVASPVLGLQVRDGQECAERDLAVAVGLTASTATIRLENKSEAGIGKATVKADLMIRVGSLQLTSLPENCVSQSVSAAKVHVECMVDYLAFGQPDTLLFGFQSSPRVIGNRITISASAQSPAKEIDPDNNSATKWIKFWPALK